MSQSRRMSAPMLLRQSVMETKQTTGGSGKRPEVVLRGPPLPQEQPISLAEVLLAALRSHNGKTTAQVEVETGRALTYSHLTRLSLSAVQGLKAQGVTSRTIVTVISYNSQECHIVMLAVIFLGATIAPLDPSLNPDEMAALLDIIEPSLIYTEGGKTLRKVELALSYIDTSPLIVVSGKQRHSHLSFDDIIVHTDPEFRPGGVDINCHVAFIICSSGTTGLPKAVMVSDSYFLNSAQVKNARKRPVPFVWLISTPIFCSTGLIMFFTTVISGAKRVFLRGPAKETVVLLETIHNYKIQLWFASPSTLQSILHQSNYRSFDLSSLNLVSTGGACLSADTQVRLQRNVFRGRTQLYQSYGMTEIGVACISYPGCNKPGACGKLIPGAKCKIVDLETEESLSAEEEGELCIKSPSLMLGYCNSPEATALCFDDQGWFHTGDIGYFDQEGFVYILDRLKDLIKYKSHQIIPSELESILLTHPAVKDVAVFGVPHPTDGDHATAFIVARFSVSETQLLEFVADRVAESKQLRGGIRFVEFIPRTVTGKPRRRTLRAQLIAEQSII